MGDLRDPCSASQGSHRIQHVLFDWTVDFENNEIFGSATYDVAVLDKKSSSLVLDVRELNVKAVEDDSGSKLTHETTVFCQANPSVGSSLNIHVPAGKDKLRVKITYATSKNCSALQWLAANQTAGKQSPFMFSQCQAIHARSLFPCQDTPAIKFTYEAKVKVVPSNLTVVMGALPVKVEPSVPGVFHFQQRVPIPSYLLAIAAGALVSRKIGPRSYVWSEKELVEKAAYEFGETEKMLQIAESLVGSYEWTDYSILVLPPSFPFGGMENPCLTFVTPTLLAGDRSLADVIAHEISHSWTGNLMTNETFEHFWLNEGYTTYLERMILGRLHGEPLRHLKAVVGLKGLQYAIKEQFGEKHPFTKLVPDLKGIDPDDAFSCSRVPYDKGFTLLFHLEQNLGRDDFVACLKAMVAKHKGATINTTQWKQFIYDYFTPKGKKDFLDSVEWDKWFYATGMPPVIPKYDDSLVQPCKKLADSWADSDGVPAGRSAADLTGWYLLQIEEFLELLLLKPPLSHDKVKAMAEAYQFGQSGNMEIKFLWLRVGLRAKYPDIIPEVCKVVAYTGRMKYVCPLYRDMFAWDKAKPIAEKTFYENKPYMHTTTAGLVEKMLTPKACP